MKIIRRLKRKFKKPDKGLLSARLLVTNALDGKEAEVKFEFSLDRDNNRIKAAGAYINGKIILAQSDFKEAKIVETSQFNELRFVQYVGCVALEGISENGETEICRSDMKNSELFRSAVCRMEALRAGKELHFEEDSVCAKCGRKVPNGTKYCMRCTDKKKLFLRLLPYAKPAAFFLLTAAFLLILTSGLTVLLPRINRVLIDDYINAQNTPENPYNLFWLVGAMAAVGASVALFTMIRRILTAKASARILVDIRRDIYEKVQELSLSGLSKRTSGEMINRISNDTREMREFIVWLVPGLLQQGLVLLAAAILLFLINWKLTLLILVPVPLLVLLFMNINRMTRSLYHRQWHLESDTNSLLHDIFTGIREVKVYGTEKREQKRFDKAAEQIADVSKKNELIWGLTIPFATFLLGIGEYAVLYFVGGDVITGEMTLGQLSEFLAYVALMYEPIRWFSGVPRRLVRALTSLAKITEILDEKSDLTDKEAPIEAQINGDIEFSNVCFGYNPADFVLKNINLSIKKGDFIGLVGRSGVGKTTAINLIMRLYDVNEGVLKVDGRDIRDYSQSGYRDRIGAVLQETFLFTGTIYSNLLYAKPDATREEIIRACKLANAHEFILKQPDGYNTYVGQRGHTLSGGEKQRIAIARAILRNPRILLLDEATSSLDTETEKQIQDAVAGLSSGRTTIAIAHRLSTLRNATKLVVFEKGEIEEMGTHEELLANKGRYYNLVMAQRQTNKLKK